MRKGMLIVIGITALFSLNGCCALLGKGCGPKCQIPGETRCNGQTVEICHGGKEWLKDKDCAKMNLACKKDGKYAFCAAPEVKK